MKSKIDMAHEMIIAMQSREPINDMALLKKLGWRYADLMHAEFDNREKEKLLIEAESHKIFMDMLNQKNQNHHDELVSIGLEDWQPDWSQAPDWANYWYTDGSIAMWSSHDPKYYDPFDIKHLPFDLTVDTAPTFNYQGDWLESLRARP